MFSTKITIKFSKPDNIQKKEIMSVTTILSLKPMVKEKKMNLLLACWSL